MKRKYDKHQIAEIMKKGNREGYGTIGRSLGMSRQQLHL